MYGNANRNLEIPLDSQPPAASLDLNREIHKTERLDFHEIKSTVVFHVAAFLRLGSSSDAECIAVKFEFQPD